MMMRRVAVLAFAFLWWVTATGAQEQAEGATQQPLGKLRVEGDTLYYSTETPSEDEESGIESEDIDPMLALLRAHPEVTTLELDSTGGGIWAANKISDIIIDFELDTHVHGDCDSSCVIVFLAGTKRTMSRGSRMGFHQTYWRAENIETYYEREREDYGWDTPFEFAEWLYGDTQQEVYEHLGYMIARGVDPVFAIETIKNTSDEMWRPYRVVLRAAGVLTE